MWAGFRFRVYVVGTSIIINISVPHYPSTVENQIEKRMEHGMEIGLAGGLNLSS